MQFSITNAAFEGFRVMKRAPVAVVMWGVTYFICLAVIVFAAGAAVFSALAGVETGTYDYAQSARVMGSVVTAYLLAIPLFLVAGALVVAATCRAVLTPKKPGFFFMQLGGAELRLMGAYLLLLIGGIVVIFVFGLLFAMVAGGAFLMGGGLSNPQPTPSPAFALIYPLYFGAICLYVWIAVRLSLLGPITVAEGRFAIGRSWAATKGHFWTLLDLGAATIVRWFLVYFVAVVAFAMIMMVGMGLFTPESMSAMEGGDSSQVMGKVLPLLLVFAVLMAAFTALQFTILSTPFAVFYRDVIAAKPAADVVDPVEV